MRKGKSRLKNNDDNSKDFSFENRLNRLREVVKEMDEGNLSLDDSLKLFEEGIKLYRSCNTTISEAEQKINILLKNEKGELSEESFVEFKGE